MTSTNGEEGIEREIEFRWKLGRGALSADWRGTKLEGKALPSREGGKNGVHHQKKVRPKGRGNEGKKGC